MMRRLVVLILLAGAVGGAAWARGRLSDIDASGRGAKDLLYLPNGKYLRAVSMGHAPLVADLVYLWAIQYYSDYTQADRYRYVEHVFGDVIAELDPGYLDPYWLGALILTTEAKDEDAGLRLLDRGFEKNPSAWILPFLAGWECERVGRFDQAAAYFERAANTPGAPTDLIRLKAGMTARTGNLREAIVRWREVFADPRNNEEGRAIATRQIRALTVRADAQDLDAAIAVYRQQTGRAPRNLDELVRAKILTALPRDPDGNPYTYDPVAGTVSSTASRVLGS
jgi:tetratricopeptide (TPR) repeat protein